MSKFILILEDTAARIDAMQRVLSCLLPRCEVAGFDDATDWINWSNEHLGKVVLICLNHDLGPNRSDRGEQFDPGTGRDAANVLAAFPPVCPVIVHSSNSIAVPGMLQVLRDAGWPCSAVVPSDDLRWVDTAWRDEVAEYIRRGWVVA